MPTNSDNDVFWLARYAHNTLAPLFAEAKAIEPSIKVSIEMSFANPDVPHTFGHVSVFAHWSREAMFAYEPRQLSKADIDTLANKVRDKIAALKLKESNPWTAALESVTV